MKTRKSYSKEFKLDAVSLVTEQNYKIAEAARSLGISANMLGRWLKEQESEGAHAFRGNGKLTPEQEEIRQLRAENKRLKMEKEILKKATEDSSQQSNSYTKILICMRTLDETVKAYIYPRRKKPCF